MKALLKKNFLIFMKSFGWLKLAAFLIVYVIFGRLDTVYLYTLLYLGCLRSALTHREALRKSGDHLNEAFYPLDHKDRVMAEYIPVFIVSMIFTAVSLYASPWTYRFFRLFPMAPLVPAAILMPWYHLNDNEKMRFFVEVVLVLIVWFLFSLCRNVPVVIRQYPMYLLILVNVIIIAAYILSALLAIRFAERKRGDLI